MSIEKVQGMNKVEPEKIRILVVDDHPMVREGLQSILQRVDDLEFIGEAATGQDAVTQVEDLQPDLVLLDIHLPDLDGLTVLRQIKALASHICVLMVTMHEDKVSIHQAIQAGAAGYVLKGVRRRELIAAIRMAVARAAIPVPFVIGNEPSHTAVTERPLTTPLGTPMRITDQELLRCLADGLNNKEISANMKWSPGTVKKHIQRLFELLEVSDRTQAVATALRTGLIQ